MSDKDKYVGDNGPKNDSIKLSDEPVWKMSYKELLISIPKRLIALVAKAIGIKMLMFYAATYLLLKLPERFPVYAWLIVVGMVIFGREFLKFMKDIKK